MTTVPGTITGGGVGDSITLTPAVNENIAVVIISGDYSGFSGIFETSPNGTTNWTPLAGIKMDNYLPDGPSISPQSGTSQSWGFNITAANVAIRLRPTSYGSGAVSVVLASVTQAGGIPVLTTPVPTPVDRSLQGAATQLAPTMPAVLAKTNYVERIFVNGKGATASAVKIALLSGLAVGTLAFPFVVPAGTGVQLGGGSLDITFQTPFAASGVNVAIVLTVPSFGSGNTNENCGIQGHVQ